MSAITSSILYAKSKAGITVHGDNYDLREQLITGMEISQSGGAEERIAVLEAKAREMDALVKGLLNEMLDLKTISKKLSQQARDYEVRESAQVIVQSPSVASDGSTMIRTKAASRPEAPAAPPEPEMVRIMQTDGTMKMEPRYGENRIDSSKQGYGRNRKGAASQAKQNPLIYAADQEKSGTKKK